jgi:hypothetical protein
VGPQRRSDGGCDVKHSLLCVVFLAGLFLALDDTAAVETTIGDTTIELVAPAGYCPLDSSGWPESQLIDFTSDGIKKQGERLGYFVDCERARSWHEGGSSKNEGDIVDYQASLEFRSQNVTSAMLAELCATLQKADDTTKGWLDIFLRAIKSAVKGRYGGEEDATLTYVVLGYEDTTCYVFRASLMRNREQVHTVSALAIVKRKLVTIHLSRKFGNMDLLKGNAEDVIKHLLAVSRETTTALIAANQ